MLLYRPALHGLKTEHKSKYPSDGLGVVIVAKHRMVKRVMFISDITPSVKNGGLYPA